MNELLISAQRPVVKVGGSYNIINGSDAESVGAALILSATRGEVHWGSREEDGKKIDLKLSVDHPWLTSNRLDIKIQVKSGVSYGSRMGAGFKLAGTVISDLRSAGSTACAIWIDGSDGVGFWAYVHPNTSKGVHEYGVMHKISPATLYDLARCDTRFTTGFAKGGNEVTLSAGRHSLTTLRAKARAAYKSFGSILSPVLGEIEITRTGWRHMFRASRKTSGKEASLRVIPHLGRILKDIPSDHFIPEYEIKNTRGMEVRSALHILKYDGVKASAGIAGSLSTEVIVKVQEDIRYPVNWRDTAYLSQQVERRVVLISTYYKEV